ncbi:MAG: hypothetical protein Tsb0032_23270 [Kiloniellaceae bacterium]
MRRRLATAFSAVLLSSGLAACDPGTQAMLAGASLVSFVHTDKTLGDHVSTWAFDKDCSSLRLANGEEYCREHVTEAQIKAAEAEAAAKRAGTYCYRTLGAINCFREPDSMASSAARVR